MMRGVYKYLGEKAICVEAPPGLFERIGNNMEEECRSLIESECTVRVLESGSSVKIVPNKAFPYARVEKKLGTESHVFEYYRYGSHVASISELGPCGYSVRTRLKNDEVTALRCFKKAYLKSKESKKKYFYMVA